MTHLNSRQTEFIESVIKLEPNLATFDCDGTLWSGDAGEGFFTWELERSLVSANIADSMNARYADYKAGKVAEDVMCGEMVTMHRGLREDALQEACDTFFAQAIAPNIFLEMRELIRRLIDSGCDVWAVSSSNVWIIRSAMKYFGVAQNQILAAEAAVEDSGSGASGKLITDRLTRVPSGPGKPQAIRSVLQSPPGCAFGNAIWDREMLDMANHAFAVNPNPNLKEIALAKGWTVYQPESALVSS